MTDQWTPRELSKMSTAHLVNFAIPAAVGNPDRMRCVQWVLRQRVDLAQTGLSKLEDELAKIDRPELPEFWEVWIDSSWVSDPEDINDPQVAARLLTEVLGDVVDTTNITRSHYDIQQVAPTVSNWMVGLSPEWVRRKDLDRGTWFMAKSKHNYEVEIVGLQG